LGFENFSEQSLATKMANSPKIVLEFLENLTEKAQKKSDQEFKLLIAFVKQTFNVSNINPWDLAYYAEKYRQSLFNFSEEDLRPYFPLDKVLRGMFTIMQKIYGMNVKEIESINAWHADVRCFEITDTTGTLRGKLFLDLFARAHKRNGAWMDSCKNRRQLPDGSIQYPEAYLTCNFSAPLKGKAALLTHDEVVTLFHETGHCLHHVLTQINYLDVAGIHGVEWDAVELPSQFFENFCWEEESLALISGHYQTNEPLPIPLKEKMLAAKNFHIGLHLTRQLTFALFDFQLHQKNLALKISEVQTLLNQIRNKIFPFKTPEYNRFQHSFSHIFSGGYAAGYYSYLWAEVLAHDAFSAFKEAGIFNSVIGQKFLHSILEKGGSKNAMALFIEFRGRAPQIDALLESYGME
jgi:oligopeptidase A